MFDFKRVGIVVVVECPCAHATIGIDLTIFCIGCFGITVGYFGPLHFYICLNKFIVYKYFSVLMTDYCQFQLDSIAIKRLVCYTNDYAQPDSFTSGGAGNSGNSIVNDVSYTGNQSWWFKRGYDSAGSGTPYSPSIDNPTKDFEYDVWIKAASSVSDGSRLAIVTGNEAKNDRASNYLEVENKDDVLYFKVFVQSQNWDGAYDNMPMDP